MIQTHNEKASFHRIHGVSVADIPWLTTDDSDLQAMLSQLLAETMAYVKDYLDDGSYTLSDLRNILDKSDEVEAALWYYLGVLMDCQQEEGASLARMYCKLNGTLMNIMTPPLSAIEWDIIQSKLPEDSIIGMTDLSDVLDPVSSVLIDQYDVSPMDAGEAPVLWAAEKCDSPKLALAQFNELRARNGSPHIYAPYGHPSF